MVTQEEINRDKDHVTQLPQRTITKGRILIGKDNTGGTRSKTKTQFNIAPPITAPIDIIVRGDIKNIVLSETECKTLFLGLQRTLIIKRTL